MEVEVASTSNVVQHSAGYLTARKRPQHRVNLDVLKRFTPAPDCPDVDKVAIIMMND